MDGNKGGGGRYGSQAMRVHKRRFEVTATFLKVFGCVTFFFYYFGEAVIQNGLLNVNGMTARDFTLLLKSDPDMFGLAGVAVICQLIGALAIPIFAYLLVEGFLHTADLKKYFLRMGAFAIISEIPFDLAMGGKILDLSSQNILVTYFIALIMLYGLSLFNGKSGMRVGFFRFLIILAAIFWSSFLQGAFSLCTVILVAVYYLLREKAGMCVLLGAAVSTMYATAAFSGYLLWGYDGKPGKCINKYVFYFLYPAALLMLAVARYGTSITK